MKGYLIDIDGVLRLGGKPIEGAQEFIRRLNQRGVPFVLVTNNSTRTPEDVAEKLRRDGFDITPKRIITSAVATAAYLSERYGTGRKVFVIGEKGLRTALEGIGWHLLPDHKGAEFLVIGLDRHCDYDRIREGIRAVLMENAVFVASNRDRTMPSEDGPLPGAGTIVTAVEYATGVTPTVIGKPNPFIGEIAIKRLGSPPPDEIFVIGDRPETDIRLAKNIGARAILVLSGVTSESELDAIPEELKPDMVVKSVGELII